MEKLKRKGMDVMKDDREILEKTVEVFNLLKDLHKCVSKDEIELMTSIENLLKENENFKQAAIINDRLYETAKQEANNKWETKIKEKIEELEKEASSYTTMRNCKRTVSYALVEAQIKVLQELPRKGKVRWINIKDI